MELVPEGDARGPAARRSAAASRRRCALALQAAEGLAAVHRAGIVHRDLKTLNLMVDGTGRLRLMDFGIAKPRGRRRRRPAATRSGSPEYMSPEQARGRAGRRAQRRLLARRRPLRARRPARVPFRAETPVATLLQHLEASAAARGVRRAAAAGAGPRPRQGPGRALRRRREDGRGAAGVAGGARSVAGSAAAALAARGDRARAGRGGRGGGAPPPDGAAAGRPCRRPRWPRRRALPRRPASTALAGGRGSRPRRPSPRVRRSAPVGTRPILPPRSAPTPTPTPATPPPSDARAGGRGAGRRRRPRRRPTPEADGALLVVARPWADVSVDGVPRGQTPLGRIPLPPGPHAVLLTHPDYQPYPRRVTIRPAETFRLTVDLATDGVRRR